MELAKYKACICEGSAENAIMDILNDDLTLGLSHAILRNNGYNGLTLVDGND